MAKNKAFIRYANNKAVPGSLIVRKKAPSVGVWKEVPADLCCGGSNSDQTLCFTSVVQTLTDFWVINGKIDESPLSFSTYLFTDPGLNLANSFESWVEIANQDYSWMGVTFSINSENPDKVDICVKESLLKSIFPAEDGSTFQFYIGPA